MIVAVVVLCTLDVVIEKVVLEDPAGIVTVGGTVTLLVFELTAIADPPDGAIPFRPTVPIDPVPPMTDVGATEKLLRPGGLTVSAPVTVEEPRHPVIVTFMTAEIAEVVIVKVAEVAPFVTVTDPGTVAQELFELRVTVTPADADGPDKKAVPTA